MSRCEIIGLEANRLILCEYVSDVSNLESILIKNSKIKTLDCTRLFKRISIVIKNCEIETLICTEPIRLLVDESSEIKIKNVYNKKIYGKPDYIRHIDNRYERILKPSIRTFIPL